MPTYIIERDFPNAGAMSEDELKGMAQKSNEVIKSMPPDYKWVRSYVCDNKVRRFENRP